MDDAKPATPNPDLSITPCGRRVQALHAGHLIADSDEAVLVREVGHGDAYYFPRHDVEMAVLAATHQSITSPLGSASLWTVSRDARIWENGAWSFERPAPGAEALQGLITFRPDIVDIQEVGPNVDERKFRIQVERIGDYIRHTDSGSGVSQKEHWPPTVHRPAD